MYNEISNDPMSQEQGEMPYAKMDMDLDRHFDKHELNGKILSIDKNCYFCQRRLEGERA